MYYVIQSCDIMSLGGTCMGSTVNLTFSIPIDLSVELHAYIKKRGLSKFVAEAIKKSLAEKKRELKEQYLMANEDEGQNEAAMDWESALMDGSDEW